MGLKGRNLLTKLDFRSSRSHRTCLYKCGDACSKPVPNTSNNTYFGNLMDREFTRRSALRTGGAAVVTVGGASFIAYSAVTWAFTQAPIALVTALRETSIIFALMIGVFLLGERLSLAKVLSTALTLAGAVLLRVSRA